MRQAKGKIAPKKDVTIREFMDEYVEVYGLKKWGNSFYTANLGLIKNYKMFYKLIEENSLRPVVFHSLRHSSTSLKLKLSRGNIKAVQGDTGHAEARMVTDTYAHGFDADRKLIAQEMDSGFFSKVGVEADQGPVEADSATVDLLKQLVRQHPELLTELLKETAGERE